jgi:hypothetical protein
MRRLKRRVRTDHSLEVWQEALFTQVAVGWVLASVFVRFCEDNGLILDPLISGPDNRRLIAEDSQAVFYREHPAEAERGYLKHVFETASRLPGLSDVLGDHSPFRLFGPSNDACRELLELWRKINPETGVLVWDFTDPDLDTRFLGDLYQDLSESARKTYALLQTPDFVEEFILDRTLEQALDEFGLNGFRMIDPACGSGHFLLGAFQRIFDRWQQRDSAAGGRANAARALDSVHGVDLNPYATAIARFRLLVAALKVANIRTLADAPAFHLNLATGDSLLHGPPPGQQTMKIIEEQDPATRHLYETEDGEIIERILGQKYHAVVANPPYITPKDPAANQAYRRRYATCHRQYQLTVPFMERLFDLAIRGGPTTTAGYVGQITGNGFMRREFGKPLVETFLSKEVELTAIINTSGAVIPAHGTPTVILQGRNRVPVSDMVKTVLAIRGEPSAPPDPATGHVWLALQDVIDRPGHENEYLSCVMQPRSALASHPWNLQGGGAVDVQGVIETNSGNTLESQLEVIGYIGQTNADDVFVVGNGALARKRIPHDFSRELVVGELLRDWSAKSGNQAVFPYKEGRLHTPGAVDSLMQWLFPYRANLGNRRTFAKQTYFEEGRPWWEWHQVAVDRLRDYPAIIFAYLATHNHFVFQTRTPVTKQSALIIQLTDRANSHPVLGALNSSAGCFWMKQVLHDKGVGGIGGGIGDEAWERRYDFDTAKLKRFPLPSGSSGLWAEFLDASARELQGWLPAGVAAEALPSAELLAGARRRAREVRHGMVSAQEELDWRCYHLYGLTDEDLSLEPDDAPPIEKGERAFEIALARRMAAGEVETSWFERHGSTPITELPAHWTDDYTALVERRLELIESDRFINLVERPEYKRRWNWEDWDTLQHQALQDWLLDRLEHETLWSDGRIKSCAELADLVRTDEDFTQVADLYAGTPDYDLTKLITDLVTDQAVPYLAAWRYTEPGLRTRAAWEKTWDLQRREDAGEDVGTIPVPPKYKKTDFQSGVYWTLRGKLDVPKERFISYPGLNLDTDPTPHIGWAGWDHLEQANALAAYYQQRRTTDAWTTERLTPILAGLTELLPWLLQWHNTPDPTTGQQLGTQYQQFLQTETNTHNLTHTHLTTWKPQAGSGSKRSK